MSRMGSEAHLGGYWGLLPLPTNFRLGVHRTLEAIYVEQQPR